MTCFRLWRTLWVVLFWAPNNHLLLTRAQVCDAKDGTCEEQAGGTTELVDVEVQETLDDLVEWLRELGGFFHPKLEIKYTLKSHEDQNDFDGNGYPSYEFGLFVKPNETIKEGELILYFPSETIIYAWDADDPRFDESFTCTLAENFAREIELHRGGESGYGAYIDFVFKYLLSKLSTPYTWSDAGRDFLNFVVGNGEFPTIQGGGINFCLDAGEYFGDREFWDDVIEFAISQRRDTNLVPIYDLISHSEDPAQINIAPTAEIDEGEGFGVKTTRALLPGEEIKYTYRVGRPEYFFDPDTDYSGDFRYGTHEMFRDHGFVESFPHRWHSKKYNFDYSVRQGEDGQLEIVWHSDIPRDEAFELMESDMIYYSGILEDLSSSEVEDIPINEVKLIEEYITALVTGLALAVRSNPFHESEYLVQEETATVDNVDRELFLQYQCNNLILRTLHHDEYDEIDQIQTAYQEMKYYRDPKTGDNCFFIDDVHQQCLSYWPHYHELVVHKPAKYLKDVKRALWVGGGDSGVLNEFLKYPNLELAVGLELDQQVTRLAFKHFASLPHFDNPKVEWWYGDASKSLLMLPKEYFGSFDLVVVDLSDTVFSLSVSSELDVIEALSLLLRPGGIFEFNELFLKKVSDVFEYSMHYEFTDVPKICDQAAIFASHDVDFMRQDLTEHEFVENATLLVEKDSMKTRHQFDRVHDYRRNPSPKYKKLCKKMEDGEKKEKSQTQASGIMMIVEAENLTADLSSPEMVRSSIVKAIEEAGLTTVPDKTDVPPSSSSSLFIVMDQGYIMARLSPEAKYCALDIHLWSSFASHDALKEAIVVKALGGDLYNGSTSSYRIVAGGMFGLPNWQEESATHGPQISKVCQNEQEVLRDSASDVKVFKQAVAMSLDVLEGDDLIVAVLCGEEAEQCPSLEVLQGNSKFKQVLPFYECPLSDDVDDKEACTIRRAHELLKENLGRQSGDIHAIVLDSNSSRVMGSIIGFLQKVGRIDLDNIFVVATTDSKGELWRRRLVDDVRTGVKMDPVFRTHVLFNTTTSSLELSITASGDELFLEHLTKAVKESQAKTPDVTLEIRNAFGGHWHETKLNLVSDSDFSHVTAFGDYDTNAALAQWKSQKPVALQTLLQFSNTKDGTPTVIKMDELVTACSNAFKARPGSSWNVHEDFGGDGALCAGSWDNGTAVVLWDGRSQVDLNIYSVKDRADLTAFEQDIKSELSGLGGWLRDIQPRGHGRVVNFPDDLRGTNFFSQHYGEQS